MKNPSSSLPHLAFHESKSGFHGTVANLRLVRESVLREYISNTRRFHQVGNLKFADFIQRQVTARVPANGAGDERWVLYHAWLPIRQIVSSETASVIKRMIRRGTLRPRGPLERHIALDLTRLGYCDDVPVDLDAVVQRSRNQFIAIQNRFELREFLEVVRKKPPRAVLEIGSARGGMLYCLSQIARPDAVVISVDLPGAKNCGGQTETERELFATFGGSGQRFAFVPQNSLHASTREAVRVALRGRKLDLLFIDGDHSYGGVRSDFEMYGELVAPEGLIVLHDICMTPDNWGDGNEVGLFWKELERVCDTTKVVDPRGRRRRTGNENGSEEWAWGIGLVTRRAFDQWCARHRT